MIDVEIIEDEFKAPVLKDIKYPVSSNELDNLLEEYKEVPTINPEGENVTEEYQYVLKGHKAFVKARNGIEKVRKELKAPSLDYGKRVDSIAKEFQAKIAPKELQLFTQRKAVEDNEKRKQEAYELAEAERREAIELKISKIKNLPLDHFNSSTNDLTQALESLRVITTEEYEEFYDEAQEVSKNTILQLQTARDNAIKAEQADKIQAENEARLAEEQRLKDEELNRERLAMQAEREAMEREREEFDRQRREQQEEINRKNAEIEAERLEKEQAHQAELRKQQEEINRKNAEAERLERERLEREEQERLDNISKQQFQEAKDISFEQLKMHKTKQDILNAIIENKLTYIKWIM